MRLESQAETLIGCWKEGSGSHWGSVSPGMVASGPPFERTQGNAAEPGEQCQRNQHLSPSFPKQINKLPLVLKRVDHKLLATHLITIQSLFLSHSSFFLFLNFFHLLDYNCLTTVLQVLKIYFWHATCLACRIFSSQPRINSRPLQWQCRVLTTGPPGKS